jgi:O-antigen/teichoic acid export membrane protein
MGETRAAFYLLALSIPFVMVVAGLRGLLEAHQRFGIVNALRVPLFTFNFLGPAVTLLWSARLDVIIAVLVAGRVVAAWIHFHFCRKVVPSLRGRPSFRRSLVGPLVQFGGWMTVSNVIGPLMVYFDRFLIGGRISMSAVAFYVTPYEMVTKLSMVPQALTGVLFPAFSSTAGAARDRAAALLDKGVRYVYLALFPATIAIVTLAQPGLEIWLGADFASQSTRVLQWLAAGVFVNGLAQVPFTFLQGAGRPDLTAKLHFAELPVYVLLLWWAVQRFGIVGAAVVWAGRVLLDAAVIFARARELVKGRSGIGSLCVGVGASLVVFLAGSLLAGNSARVAFLIMVLGAFLPVAWRLVLGEEDRARVLTLVRTVRVSRGAGR